MTRADGSIVFPTDLAPSSRPGQTINSLREVNTNNLGPAIELGGRGAVLFASNLI